MTTLPKPKPETTAPVAVQGADVGGPIARWLDALRDGEYAQGYFYLMQNDDVGLYDRQFCCLGVACEISAIGDWDGDDEPKHTYVVSGADALDGGAPGTIPEGVRTWLGLRTPLGEFYATHEWLAAIYDAAPVAADKVVMHLTELNQGDFAALDAQLDAAAAEADAAPLTLAGLNDAGGLTFREIADVIESCPPGLFE